MTDICKIDKVPRTKFGCERLLNKLNNDVERLHECQSDLLPIISACSNKLYNTL